MAASGSLEVTLQRSAHPRRGLPTANAQALDSGAAGGSPMKARVYTGPRKPSAAERASTLCQELLECLRSEQWRAMRSTNLGVLSGTGVVEELLMRQLQSKVSALHMLVTKHETAGQQLRALASQLSKVEMQQMQVLLDSCGHSELSDYLRVLRYNISDPAAQQEVGVTPALMRRRARTTPRAARPLPQDDAAGSSRRLGRPGGEDPNALRFAELLGPQSRLVSTAISTLEARRLAAERAAAEAAEARRRGSASAGNGSAHEDDRLGWWRREQEFLARKVGLLTRHDTTAQEEYYMADVEARWRASVYRSDASQLWHEGALDHAVLIAEPLPLYGSGSILGPGHIGAGSGLTSSRSLAMHSASRTRPASSAVPGNAGTVASQQCPPSGIAGGSGGSFSTPTGSGHNYPPANLPKLHLQGQ